MTDETTAVAETPATEGTPSAADLDAHGAETKTAEATEGPAKEAEPEHPAEAAPDETSATTSEPEPAPAPAETPAEKFEEAITEAADELIAEEQPVTDPTTAGATLATAVAAELENAKNALARLKTSSNATFQGTTVYDVVQLLTAHVAGLEAALTAYKG